MRNTILVAFAAIILASAVTPASALTIVRDHRDRPSCATIAIRPSSGTTARSPRSAIIATKRPGGGAQPNGFGFVVLSKSPTIVPRATPVSIRDCEA